MSEERPMVTGAAAWSYDPDAEAWYFRPVMRHAAPFTQRRVEALLDIAADGTLAGIEVLENIPPPKNED